MDHYFFFFFQGFFCTASQTISLIMELKYRKGTSIWYPKHKIVSALFMKQKENKFNQYLKIILLFLPGNWKFFPSLSSVECNNIFQSMLSTQI